MKKHLFSLSLIVFLFPIIMKSQNPNPFQLFKLEDHWLLDSIFEYKNYYGDDQSMTRIKSRNAASFPLLEETQKFNFDTQEYEFAYSTEYEYPIEYDTTEYSFVNTYRFSDNDIDRMRYYINYNDNGFKTTSNEYWDTDHWSYGEMEKLKHSEDYLTYHRQKYHRYTEAEDWILYDERMANYNEDSTILSDYIINIDNGIPDTISKRHLLFNSEGNWILIEYFEKQNEEWYLQFKEICTYNSENLISESLSLSEHDGELINNYKYIFDYDENNFLSYRAEYDWDKNDEFWEYEDLTTYENDSNGNILKKTAYKDIEDTIWVKRHKWEYVYNTNNQIINEKKFSIYADSIWRPKTNTTNSYLNELRLTYLYQVWDTSTNTYQDHMKSEYELDDLERPLIYRYYSSLPPNELELQYISEYEYMETENQYTYKVFTLSSPDWDTILNRIRYYNKYTTGINEIKHKEFDISPIPASEQILLSSDHYFSQNISYEILSMSGHQLSRKKLNPSGILDIKDLQSGQYLLKLYKPNGKIEVLKFQKL